MGGRAFFWQASFTSFFLLDTVRCLLTAYGNFCFLLYIPYACKEIHRLAKGKGYRSRQTNYHYLALCVYKLMKAGQENVG
jgi:hypothetical protein